MVCHKQKTNKMSQQNTILSQQPSPRFKQNATNKTTKQMQKTTSKTTNKTTNKMPQQINKQNGNMCSAFCVCAWVAPTASLGVLPWPLTPRTTLGVYLAHPAPPGLRSPLVVRGVVRCLACGVRNSQPATSRPPPSYKQNATNKRTKQTKQHSKCKLPQTKCHKQNATNKTTKQMQAKCHKQNNKQPVTKQRKVQTIV